MPFWVDHADGDVAPYTTARAMTAGWMWQIPTVDRMGCGYVYSDAYISADEAQSEVEALLGQPIEPRADIAINAGRLARPWVGNCVALGLCQSFLEPLEATSVHGTVVQLMMLGQGGFLPKLAVRVGGLDLLRRAYCDAVNTQIDDFAEFINLHYAGGRRDTPFWTEMTETGISGRNRDLVERLKHGLPQDRDFPDLPGQLPHLQRALYLPVLDGLGLMEKAPCKAILSQSHGLARRARALRQSNRKEFLKAAGQAVGHRVFLSDIAQGA
jgi:tryptophan halogenase